MFQTYTELPVEQKRHITKLAFRNRFTMPEKTKIELASLDNPSASLQDRTVAATLRAILADQRDAVYIDLDRADTRKGVEDLETFNIIALGRAAEILDAPIQAEEVFAGQ